MQTDMQFRFVKVKCLGWMEKNIAQVPIVN
jgi:hypothetical protein